MDALDPPVKLLPGERIEAVEELDLRDPETMPDSALREEEPGRIAHEIRDVETDGLWGFPYYGSVDATPLFIRAAVRAIDRRPEFAAAPVPEREASVRDSLDAAVGWLLRRLRKDDLGLPSHVRANPEGLENQVWKDSWDSMSHADGTVSNRQAPAASVEAQALAFDALVEAATQHESPTVLLEAASRLERAVEEHLWVDDSEGGYYAIGVDRDPESGAPRPLQIHASNMGWLLNSRLLDGPEHTRRRQRLVDLLLSDEFLAEGGIRTLSSREARFRPRAYHNGNVWGHDNYVISLGFDRHGFRDEAQELRRRLAAVCRATHRFPEFVAGGEPGTEPIAKRIVDVYDSRNDRVNRVEQPPQEIQGWTVGAMVAIEHAGIHP